MKIEIQPRSLLNLQNICEVLYKLHPNVLNYLVDMQRTLGGIMGMINLNQPTLKQREFLSSIKLKEVEVNKDLTQQQSTAEQIEPDSNLSLGEILCDYVTYTDSDFYDYKKYLKLDTYDYIPIKVSIEVEDPVIGRKVRELVDAMVQTGAPEQFLWGKEELDIEAYFAEGYGLTMNEEQKMKMDDFYDKKDCKSLKKFLLKEKLYP